MCEGKHPTREEELRQLREPESTSEEDDTESEPEPEPEPDEENYCIIRAKWMMDGANTLDEAIEKIHAYIGYLEELKEEGWELREPISDDYGYIYQDKKPETV